jgi:hypothetical protein
VDQLQTVVIGRNIWHGIEAGVAHADDACPVMPQTAGANGHGTLLSDLEILIWKRVVVTATSGMTEAAEAIGQAVAAAVDPPFDVIGTAVLVGTGTECGTDRGRKNATAAATEHMNNIALGEPDPLAHPYAGVRAAAPVRVLGFGIGHDQVRDLRDGDLGLGVGRLRLL